MSQVNMYPMSSALFSPSTTVANTNALFGGVAGWQATPIVGGLFTVGNIVGCGGTITLTGWKVKLQVAPGGVASMTFTVFKNNVPTSMTVTITGSATTAVWSGSVSFGPSDIITVTSLPTGTPTVSGSKYVNWTIQWTSSTTAFQMFTGQQGNNSLATAADFCLGSQWGGGAAWVGTDCPQEQSPIPVPGTIQNLYVYLSADPTTGGVHPGETVTVTIYRNPFSGGVNTGRVATSIQVVAGVSGASTDLSHTQHYNAGDQICIRMTSSTNCATEQLLIGYEFVPDTPGYSIVLGEDVPAGNNITQYNWLIGSSLTPTESIAQIPVFACTMSNLYARASTNSGSGTVYANIPSGGTFTISGRKNGANSGSPGNLQLVVTNSQYGSDSTNQITYADGDLCNLLTQTNATASGTGAQARWGAAFRATQLAPPSHLLALMGVGS